MTLTRAVRDGSIFKEKEELFCCYRAGVTNWVIIGYDKLGMYFLMLVNEQSGGSYTVSSEQQ